VTEKSEMTSRRQAFSILGLAALGLSVMPNLLMVSGAEAQTSLAGCVAGLGQACAATPPAPQTGTERRQARRTGRTERAQVMRGETTTPQGLTVRPGECICALCRIPATIAGRADASAGFHCSP
jgi:hypothetical protein